MKQTWRARTLLKIPVRSSFFCSTGPEVCSKGTPSSSAMMAASVVLPSPGGPYSRMWSRASLRCRAASIPMARFSLSLVWPVKSWSRRGRRPASNWASPSRAEAERMRGSAIKELRLHYGEMNDVFFSYRWIDWERAKPIVAALEARGLKVWIDRARTDAFEGVSDAVRSGLGKSKALLAFYSKDYPHSAACRWELTQALLAEQRQTSGASR